jgi:hypothetical protein
MNSKDRETLWIWFFISVAAFLLFLGNWLASN